MARPNQQLVFGAQEPDRIELLTMEVDRLRHQISKIAETLEEVSKNATSANENTVEVLRVLGQVSNRQVPVDRIPAIEKMSIWIIHCPFTSHPYQYKPICGLKSYCEDQLEQMKRVSSRARAIVKINDCDNAGEAFILFKDAVAHLVNHYGNYFALRFGVYEAAVIKILKDVCAAKQREYDQMLEAEDEMDDQPAGPSPNVSPIDSSSHLSSFREWSSSRRADLLNWLNERLQ